MSRHKERNWNVSNESISGNISTDEPGVRRLQSFHPSIRHPLPPSREFMRWWNLFRFREYHNFWHHARSGFKIHETNFDGASANTPSKHFLNNPLIGNSIKISLRRVFAAAGSGRKAIRVRNNIASVLSASKVRSKMSSFEPPPENLFKFAGKFWILQSAGFTVLEFINCATEGNFAKAIFEIHEKSLKINKRFSSYERWTSLNCHDAPFYESQCFRKLSWTWGDDSREFYLCRNLWTGVSVIIT